MGREVVGACSVLLCDFTDGGNQEPPTGAPESAGAITIGGTTPTFSLTYDPGTMQYGSVAAVPTDAPLFAGGNAITFTAAGADVTGFADMLVAPAPLVVKSPVLTSAFSIDTSRDLVFEWTGSSVGKVAFNVITTTSSAATAMTNADGKTTYAADSITIF